MSLKTFIIGLCSKGIFDFNDDSKSPCVHFSLRLNIFLGVGYVKLLAGCLLSVYYPLLIGVSVFYILWMLKGSLPFAECAVVKITNVSSISSEYCI